MRAVCRDFTAHGCTNNSSWQNSFTNKKNTNTNTNQTLQRMGAQITHFGKATLVLASMLADNNLAIQAQGSLANKYSTG